MRYQDCIFDLYGTLVDIHTDEERPQLWEDLTAWYREHGAPYAPEELQEAYIRTVRQMERGTSLRNDAHEAHPEIQLEFVFQALYRQKGIDAGLDLAVCTGERFRKESLDYIRLYDGAVELLKALRANGQRIWLLSNAQRIFTAYELKTLGIEPLFDGIYLSSDYGCKKPDCTVGCDCDRYMEIWNDVFTQFDNDGQGHYEELKDKNIDTGMGLERLAVVVQDVDSLFTVDTNLALLERVCALAGKKYKENQEDDISLPSVLAKINVKTKEQFIIIIDEWDALFREVKEAEDVQKEYLQLLRGLFKSSLTDKMIEGAYITGILPIKKYGTQSALTDFREYTMLQPKKLAKYTGFTETEVKLLCQDYGMDFEEAKRWYDGYSFHQIKSIYSPNSIIQAVQSH